MSAQQLALADQSSDPFLVLVDQLPDLSEYGDAGIAELEMVEALGPVVEFIAALEPEWVRQATEVAEAVLESHLPLGAHGPDVLHRAELARRQRLTPMPCALADLDWPALKEIPGGLAPVRELDTDWLPSPLRDWLADTSERMACPLDFSAASALCALGSAIGAKLYVAPKRYDTGFLVTMNLWGMAIADPGSFKTAAISEPMGPLRALDGEENERFTAANKEYLAQKEAMERQREALTEEIKRAARGRDLDKVSELTRAATQLEEPPRPVRRRYVVGDTTTEKLGMILADNPDGVLVFRDELAGLLESVDKKGQEGARQFLLEGWNGKNAFTVDRVTRADVNIRRLCVSVFGGVQPGPLRARLREAQQGGGADGLIQRFQVMVYPDMPEWRGVDRPPNLAARTRAATLFRRCATLHAEDVGATEQIDGVPILHFADDAQAVFDEWRDRFEPWIRNSNDPPVVKGHFSKYRSLVPAIAGILHVAEVADGLAPPGPIRLTSMLRALAWEQYLRAHAFRIYGMALYGGVAAARALSTKLLAGQLASPFRARDVAHKGWAGLTETREVAEGLELLVDCGWLRAFEIKSGPQGGRPTVEYEIPPRVRQRGGRGTP